MPSNEDVVWVDVLPSLDKLSSQLRTALPGIGQKAGQQLGQSLTDAAAAKVQQASTKMSAALRAVQDATGKVTVAEAKLQELRDSGKAKQSQIVAAEEKLAAARRNETAANQRLSAATGDVVKAQDQHTAAVRTSSTAMDEGTKKAGVLSRSFGAMRSSVAAGFAAFYAAKTAVAFLGDAVSAASDLNEEINKSQVVFGNSAGKVLDFSKSTAVSLGQSRREALAAAGTFGNLFRTIGLNDKASADMSVRLVQLASDLASFNNADPSDVLEAMRAGLVGETEPMRRFGVDISDAAMKAEALKEGMKIGPVLTQAQKAQLAYQLMLQQTTLAQGDFSRTSGGLANSQRILSAEWENAKAALGGLLIGPVTAAVHIINSSVIPAVGGVANVVGGAIDLFRSLPGPVQAGILALAGFQVLRGPLGSLFETLAVKVATMGASMGAAVSEMGLLKAASSGLMGFLGGPWGIILTGAAVLLTALATSNDTASASTKKNAQAQDDLAQALVAAKGAINDNVRAAAAKAAQDEGLLTAAKAAGVQLPLVTDAILGQGDAYNQVMAKLVGYRDANTDLNGERSKEAVLVNQAIGNLQGLAGTTDANIGKAQDLRDAESETGTTMGQTASAADQLNTQLQGTADSASAAKKQTDLLKTSLDILTGAHINMSQAEAAFYDATAQANGALKDLKGTVLDASGQLNVQSEAGRKAQQVLFDIADADNQLIATMESQGATADQVNAKDAQLRDSFVKSAMQMGINRQHALDLANEILGIPDSRNTVITADTSQATQAARELQAQIDALHGRVVSIEARAVMPDLNGSVSGNGRMGTYAGGGWTGPGAKYTPAGVVHANEYVEPSESVDYYGTGIFRALHQRRIPRQALAGLPGYADGGYVPPINIQAQLDSSGYNAAMDAAAGRFLKQIIAAQRFAPGAPVSVSANAALGRDMAARYYGWTGAEWNALWNLGQRESGWRNTAQNPTSTAYGIAQFLDSTWASVGLSKTADPVVQIAGMLKYIKQRYIDPIGAWAHETRFGWYHNGGQVRGTPGTDVPAMLLAGERVQTAPQDLYTQRLVEATLAARDGAAASRTYQTTIIARDDAATIAREVTASLRTHEFLYG